MSHARESFLLACSTIVYAVGLPIRSISLLRARADPDVILGLRRMPVGTRVLMGVRGGAWGCIGVAWVFLDQVFFSLAMFW